MRGIERQSTHGACECVTIGGVHTAGGLVVHSLLLLLLVCLQFTADLSLSLKQS